MDEMLPLSVGVGLVVGLVFTEAFGLAAGGMIVPGYLALRLQRPLDILVTVGAGFLAFAIVRTLSSFTILYGRRRTVLMILIGYLIGMTLRWSTDANVPGTEDLRVIGYVVPGLIGIWLDRQGVVETLSALATASVVVRLVLIVLLGPDIMD